MASERVLWDGEAYEPVIVFAHGAGAGPDSPFMQAMSENLVAQHIAVVRFEFPYWTQVRRQGKRRPPNPQKELQACMQDVAASVGSRPLWLMGKSMGARVAFQVADKIAARGAIGLGFPFHPPAKKDKTRTHELYNDCAENLLIHGTHDPFGRQEWVTEQQLPANLQLDWVSQGNHDLVPGKKAGISAEQSWLQIAQRVAKFIHRK